MPTKSEKSGITFEQGATIAKAAQAMVYLLVGQLTVGLIFLILFLLSFLLSPLRPLVWAQLAAVAVLILGGVALVAVVVVKYRREIASLFSKS